MRRTLIIFAKQPAPGRTKTRLAGELGLQGAADLYHHFLLDALGVARQVAGVQLALAYAPEHAAGFFGQLAPDCVLLPQQGEDLGQRMDLALCHFLDSGDSQVALVGSDIPLLRPNLISQCFAELDAGADAVFGPAEDGGYYLVGLPRPQPALLRSIPMSTPSVLRDTLAVADALRLRVSLLSPCYDVDTPADLDRLRADLAATPAEVAPHTREFLLTG